MTAIVASLLLTVVGTDDGVVRGRVVDDLGQPLPRCWVEARRADDPERKFSPPTRSRRRGEARAFEGDGAFELAGLAQGEWIVMALGEGELESEPRRVKLPGAPAELSLVVPRPARIVGVVLDRLDRPVPFAALFVRDAAAPPWSSDSGELFPPLGTADGNGRFALETVRPRRLRIAATEQSGDEIESVELDVAPASTTEVTLRLPAGARVHGRVQPSLGDPAERQVDLFSFNGRVGWRTTWSDADGRFAIEGVIAQDYVIELRPPGYPNWRWVDGKPEPIDPGVPSVRRNIEVGDGAEVEVEFARHAREIPVSGRITIAGEPAAGLVVQPCPLAGQDDLGREATTDAEGRYSVELPATGRWRFRVTKAWGSERSYEREVGDPAASPAPLVLDFDLPGGAISGVLHDAEGKPVGHVPLTLLRRIEDGEGADFGSRFMRAQSDRDGRFEFALLEPGVYDLRAPDGMRFEPQRRGPAWGRVLVTDLRVASRPLAPLSIGLRPESRIAGRVVDERGAAVERASIRVADADGVDMSATWECESDGSGRFLVTSLPPGRYVVTVAWRDGAVWREKRSDEVFASAGKVAEVVVELR